MGGVILSRVALLLGLIVNFWLMLFLNHCCNYRVSLKKRYFLDFLSYFSSRGRILLFHMCFGIRILSPFHLAIQKVSIQNLNCPKNAKNACADMIFIPAQSSLRKAGIKIMSAHAFLGQLRF